jgi:ribosomal protein S18 acetylase RimI-like enzyme
MTAIAERDAREGTADGFVELAPIVYADDPCWIPEEPAQLARAFSENNPWLVARQARTWCAPGKGRVAAFFDPALRIDGEPCAFFGYWESTGDADVARALMDRVRAWAAERGARRLFGPIQFSTAHSYRIRTSAEPGALPLLGEPYNPTRYAAELESLGFAAHQRYVTQILTIDETRATVAKLRERYDAVLARGYRIEPLTLDAWTSRLPELHAVVEEAFKSNFAYAPMRYDEFASLCGAGFVKKFDPDASLLAYGPSDDVVGFALNARDFAPILVQGAGDARVAQSAIDHAKHAALVAARGPIDLVMKTVCVLPEHRRGGMMAAYAVHLQTYAERMGARRVFGALAREDNATARLGSGAGAARWFALYAAPLV